MREVLVGAGISDDVLTERLALGGCGDVYRAVRHDPAFIITGEEEDQDYVKANVLGIGKAKVRAEAAHTRTGAVL